ncbi:MAG: MBL fold metallo-hydrolase [Elusimicrobiota bacterium]|jgi:glyoxylase-like metal-dependent hydrolase (beta-lactamase superfamily II)|nr:MBL fold metallo-hydrolase [Elusimicrobiota bacterium]
MKIRTLILGEMLNCTYIAENNGRALIIDPSWQMDNIYCVLEENKLTPQAVIFTHGHFDHLQGAAQLLKKYNLKGYIEENDVLLSGIQPDLLQPFKGDFKTNIIGLPVEFMHTPGHTKGSICIKIEDAVFTGDTLFAGACGRTDFEESDPAQMQKSLIRLAGLPPETKVYSGHAYGQDENSGTTIGCEIKNNPFMKLAVSDTKAFEDMLP